MLYFSRRSALLCNCFIVPRVLSVSIDRIQVKCMYINVYLHKDKRYARCILSQHLWEHRSDELVNRYRMTSRFFDSLDRDTIVIFRICSTLFVDIVASYHWSR
ncbi:hypothetical protein K0M31_017238 [Melipona bicolor]|uniref:Secreted protein n=1 Tax=Melipona bicolor TaxID=60889 RepID=A0AA40KS93_9HYME|nr:hypothetical protein K0M31_017238 [Melipona bicolor]